MNSSRKKELRAKLQESRRRLGPYTAIQRDDPWRVCDAEIARRLAEVIEVIDEMLTEK
jgi:hypothetical protein